MSTLESDSGARHRSGTAVGSAAVALGALVAIAVTVLMLALTGAHQTLHVNSTTPTHPTSALTAPIPYQDTGPCRAVLDPLTGQMHGGCAPDQTNPHPATSTP
jgi:hypothetical protein